MKRICMSGWLLQIGLALQLFCSVRGVYTGTYSADHPHECTSAACSFFCCCLLPVAWLIYPLFESGRNVSATPIFGFDLLSERL